MALLLDADAVSDDFLADVDAAKDGAETAAADALAILEGGEHSTEGTISAGDSVTGMHDNIQDTLLPATEAARDDAIAAAADPILSFFGLEYFGTDELDYVINSAYVSAITETNCTFDAADGSITVTGAGAFACTLRVTLGAGGAPNPMYLTEWLSWFLYDPADKWEQAGLGDVEVVLTLRNSGGTVLSTETISEKNDQGINLKGAFEIERGAAYYAYLEITGEGNGGEVLPVGLFYPSRFPGNIFLTLTDGDGRYALLKPVLGSISGATNVGAGYALTQTVEVSTGGFTVTLDNASALNGRTILFLNSAAATYEFAAGSGVTLLPAGVTTAAAYGHVWATFRGPTIYLSGDIA